MNEYLKYQRDIEPNIEESLSRIGALVEPHSLVLDIGCSSGMLGRFLSSRKSCVVDGVDIDESAVENCKPVYRKVATRNLEADTLTDIFREESYDCIVVADVIEHLVDSSLLLNQIKLLIKPGGMIYFSIPNITHISSALELLSGKFTYTRSGLLDATHLRFFTRESFIRKIEEAGIYCWDVQAVERGIDETEFGDDIDLSFPQTWLRQLVEVRPDALTYQWIFSARIFPRDVGAVNKTELSAARAIPLLNSALYWDVGNGFSEDCKMMGFSRLLACGSKILEFRLDSLAGTTPVKFRIDPISSPQWMKVLSAQLLDEGGQIKWQWQAGGNDGILANASWLGGIDKDARVILADSNDPQWIPAIPTAVLACVGSGWIFSMELLSQPQMNNCEIAVRVAHLQEMERQQQEMERQHKVLLSCNQALLDEIVCKEKFVERHAVWLNEANARFEQVINSRSWRLTKPMRWLARNLNSAPLRAFRKLTRALKSGGASADVLGRLVEKRKAAIAYGDWIVQHEKMRDSFRKKAAELSSLPLISVVMPTYNTPPVMLESAIVSVRRQNYVNWELCIADDASSTPEVKDIILRQAKLDGRIRVAFREKNGHISLASNTALELARGDYVTFLDHDDQLIPDALLQLALEIADHPSVDIIYTDEDKISEDGKRSAPFFKPDWSPHLAISQAYLGHLVCYRTTLVKQVGGLRIGFEGAQDYDLWLRVANIAKEIRHLPQVLYHWRMHAGSTAADAGAKPYAHEAGRKAVGEFLEARYPAAAIEAVDGEHLFTYRAKFSLPAESLISIIIPTKDKAVMLEECVRSILAKSTWQHFEIIIVDNNSIEPASFEFFERIQREDSRIKVLSMPIPFNWSRLNNLAAQQAKGNILLFLNNDTAVISADWLENLAGYALLSDVGSVGALLLFEDGTIQHSGVVVGMHEWAEHVFRGLPARHEGSPFVSPVLTRNVLAVTGACVAITREKFDVLGGFDEEFIICGSDVDLGIRAHKRGWFNVMCAEARLHHYESKTRTPHVPKNDFTQSEKKYAPYRVDVTDPFFSPNLALDSTTPGFK